VTPFPGAGFARMPSESASPDEARFRIPAASAVFDGHFDTAPIVPGVMHIALALETCEARRGFPAVLVGVRDVRFSHPLGPDDEVTVRLTDGQAPGEVRFELRSAGRAISSGVLQLASTNHVGH
jgi:3-hydroxymyristoyl/3-hydroxydecanoyl-(acyl carrier protein) dehydratase